MSDSLDRRQFVTAAAGLVAVTTTGSAMPAADPPGPPAAAPFVRDYPAPGFVPKFAKPLIDLTLARDFVLFAHSDLDLVEKLLAKEPALVVAAVDWGGGDFETGLGGASHLGRRDIAEFLLSRGARMDVFCAAMLGLLDVVRGMVTEVPALATAKGPHGIPLLMHAKMGGDRAAAVFDYLRTVTPAAGAGAAPPPPPR